MSAFSIMLKCANCDFRPILHKYANEDVSLGAWFIGLEVEHVDDRSMCCGTPPGKDFLSPFIYFYQFPKYCLSVFESSTRINPLRISRRMQNANGKHKQVMFVSRHLIGAAVAFANPWKESRAFMPSVVKMLPLCGMLLSRPEAEELI